MFNLDSNEADIKNPTSISGTAPTYSKIFKIIENDGIKGKILDASSGIGKGTEVGRDMGFIVDDVEPFPPSYYAPKYTDYGEITGKYDAIISNAVLNVLPQDLRDSLVKKMDSLLSDGGKIYINVRGTDVKTNKSNIPINEARMEYYVESTGSYQKGFTKDELSSYLQDALGSNYTIESTNAFGAVSAIATKNDKRKYSLSFEPTDAEQAVYDKNRANLPPEIRFFLDKMSKKTGIKYLVDNTLAEDVPAFYYNEKIILNGNAITTQAQAVSVIAHEVYHALRGTQAHKDIYHLAVLYGINNGMTEESMISAIIADKAQDGIELSKQMAQDEIGADFIEVALSNTIVAKKILTESPNIFRRIGNIIKDSLNAVSTPSKKPEEINMLKKLKLARKIMSKALSKQLEHKASGTMFTNSRNIFGTKVRGFLIHAAKSETLTEASRENIAKRITANLVSHNEIYQVAGNQATFDKAQATLKEKGVANSVASIRTKAEENLQFTKDDMVLSYMLLNKVQGNVKLFDELSGIVATAHTTAGQVTQAGAMFDRMSPEGILLAEERKAKQLNKEYGSGTTNKELMGAYESYVDMSIADSELDSELISITDEINKVKATAADYKQDMREMGSDISQAKLDAMQEELDALRAKQQTVTKKSIAKKAELSKQEKLLREIQKRVEKENGKKGVHIFIPSRLKQQLLNAKTDAEIAEARNLIACSLAEQLPKDVWRQIDAIRFFQMLANTSTHAKNLFGNGFGFGARQANNLVKIAVEGILRREVKTASLSYSKEAREYAERSFESKVAELQGSSKYEGFTLGDTTTWRERGVLGGKVGKALNKITDFNLRALEAEDMIFLKGAYISGLARYIAANKWNPDTMTLEQEMMATEHASQEALTATFRTLNSFSDGINKWTNKKSTAKPLKKAVIDGALPFRRTLFNIAKETYLHTPLSIFNVMYSAYKAAKEGGDGQKAIDEFAKFFTGTTLAAVGYLLASMGILVASAGGGGDDEKERNVKFEESVGGQKYSLVFGDTSYSIGFMTIVSAPLLIGAKIHNSVKTKDVNNAVDGLMWILETGLSALEPIIETTVYSSIMNTVATYESNSVDKGIAIFSNALASYGGQFSSSMLGKVTKIIDPYKRSTYIENPDVLTYSAKRLLETTQNKTPLWSMANDPIIDTDGTPVENLFSDALVEKIIYNLVGITNIKFAKKSPIIEEMRRLYKATKNVSVLPKVPTKNFLYKDEKWQLTSKEFVDWSVQLGTNFFASTGRAMENKNYIKMDDTQKAKVIAGINDYTNYKSKDVFLTDRGATETIEVSAGNKYYPDRKKEVVITGYNLAEYNKAKEAIEAGVPVEMYFIAREMAKLYPKKDARIINMRGLASGMSPKAKKAFVDAFDLISK